MVGLKVLWQKSCCKTRPVRYKLRSGQGKFYGFTDPTFRNCSEEQGIYSTYVKQIRVIWIWRYRCLFITNRPDQTWIYFTWDGSCYTLKVLLTIIVMKYTAEWKKMFIFRHRKSWKHYLFFRSHWNRIEWIYNCLVLKIVTDLNNISCKLLSPSLRSSLNF